jgi:serine/threonine protein phosphatase PrpC
LDLTKGQTTIMQCFKCGETVLPTDKFCEECGASLTENKSSKSEQNCQKCGAGIAAIDEDGYCSQCGFRNLIPALERLEIEINSHLAGVSDRGLKHHQNEDYLALKQKDNVQILVVCDGVSSSEKAELASRTAAETVCQYLTDNHQNVTSESAIKSAVAVAISSICNISMRLSDDPNPPSTTLVTALVKDGIATIGWLGDSRAYWLDHNGCQQLTKDDSWLTEIVVAGEMTAAEAKLSPRSHAITRWLGADAVADAVPSIINFKIPSSGYLVLCTDGLWNYAPEPQNLAELIHKLVDKDAMTISRSLVDFARNCGGHDNISVGLLVI